MLRTRVEGDVSLPFPCAI